jgi:hypothetical protein
MAQSSSNAVPQSGMVGASAAVVGSSGSAQQVAAAQAAAAAGAVPQQARTELRVGGKFRIGRKVGSGAFGDIYLGTQSFVFRMIFS